MKFQWIGPRPEKVRCVHCKRKGGKTFFYLKRTNCPKGNEYKSNPLFKWKLQVTFSHNLSSTHKQQTNAPKDLSIILSCQLHNCSKGSSINDATQFRTIFDPLLPSSCVLLLRPLFYRHIILDPLPLRP